MSELIKILLWTAVFLGVMWVSVYVVGVFLGILAYAIFAPGYFITTVLFLVAGTWCTMKLAKWLIQKI